MNSITNNIIILPLGLFVSRKSRTDLNVTHLSHSFRLQPLEGGDFETPTRPLRACQMPCQQRLRGADSR